MYMNKRVEKNEEPDRSYIRQLTMCELANVRSATSYIEENEIEKKENKKKKTKKKQKQKKKKKKKKHNLLKIHHTWCRDLLLFTVSIEFITYSKSSRNQLCKSYILTF